jgi:hypothetical protein
LFEGFRQPGNYAAIFDARTFSSGVYFYQLLANSFIRTRKLILLKWKNYLTKEKNEKNLVTLLLSFETVQ